MWTHYVANDLKPELLADIPSAAAAAAAPTAAAVPTPQEAEEKTEPAAAAAADEAASTPPRVKSPTDEPDESVRMFLAGAADLNGTEDSVINTRQVFLTGNFTPRIFIVILNGPVR